MPSTDLTCITVYNMISLSDVHEMYATHERYLKCYNGFLTVPILIGNYAFVR